jgi:hypothetical protein
MKSERDERGASEEGLETSGDFGVHRLRCRAGLLLRCGLGDSWFPADCGKLCMGRFSSSSMVYMELAMPAFSVCRRHEPGVSDIGVISTKGRDLR